MSPTMRFSTEQVAEALGLSDGVITRLAHFFQVPQLYFYPPSGQPKLWLFHPQEVEFLRQAQVLLVDGHPLQDVKRMLSRPKIQVTPSTASEPSSQEVPPTHQAPSETLITYDQDAQLKAQLADMTFKHYRLKTSTQPSAFKKLATHFKHSSDTKTLDELQANLTPEQNPLKDFEIDHTLSPPKLSSWMSPELQAQALRIQHKIMVKSRS